MTMLMSSARLSEIFLEKQRPKVLPLIEHRFNCVGLIPCREAKSRIESRAVAIAAAKMQGAVASAIAGMSEMSSEKDIENAAAVVILDAVKDACREASEYERFNPPFFRGAKYSVCEGRDL